jgi:hypothetical protein
MCFLWNAFWIWIYNRSLIRGGNGYTEKKCGE